jgi:hypothetical protein
MSTALRRSSRLVANDTSSSPDSQPPSRRELARRRAAANPPRQHIVVVEKEDSFDVMLSPMMGPFGVVEQDAVNDQTTHVQKQLLQRLTVVELKIKLKNHGMTTTGKKADLVQRMLAFEIMFHNDMIISEGR